jgi:predicted Zn-dependent peptidase
MHEQGKPRIDILFHTPGYPNDDLYKLDIVEGIFSGRSGRLYRRLVDKEGLCTNAGAQNNFRIQDGEFHVWAELKNDADPEKVEQIILEELRKIANEKPSGKEMMRITNGIRMSFVSGLKSLEGISDRLAYFERLRSWKDLLTYPEKIAVLKPDEIPAAAKKWLDPEKMTIGQLLPVKAKKPVKNQPVKK